MKSLQAKIEPRMIVSCILSTVYEYRQVALRSAANLVLRAIGVVNGHKLAAMTLVEGVQRGDEATAVVALYHVRY